MEFKEKSLVIAILNNNGARSFRIPKNSDVTQRELYYIDRIETEEGSGQTILLGRFLSQNESNLDTIKIYLKDTRVVSYDSPTKEELNELTDHLVKVIFCPTALL